METWQERNDRRNNVVIRWKEMVKMDILGLLEDSIIMSQCGGM